MAPRLHARVAELAEKNALNGSPVFGVTAHADRAPVKGEDALVAWDPHLVVVDGGNTFWLRHCMDAWMDILRDSTAVYVGVSAGSICAGRYVDTALWKGWDDPGAAPERDWEATEGLGLAGEANFFPHYSDEYEALVAERTEERHRPLVTLDEGGCYLVSGAEGRYLAPET